MEQPFKLYMVTVIGFGCGLVFQATTMNWGVMFLGMALGALVTACVVEVVYNLDFHSLFNRWRSLLIYGGVCAVVLGCMAMDITNWNSALPDRDQIVGADLRSNAPSWDCSAYGTKKGYYTEGEFTWWSLLDTVTGWASSVDRNSDEDVEPMSSDVAIDTIYNSASIGAEAMKGDRNNITTGLDYENQGYQVTFKLKNGKTFTRQYYMPANTEQLNENGAVVRFSQEYLETRTAAVCAADESFEPKALIVKNYANASYDTGDRIEQKQAMTSILKKLKAESMQLTREYVSQNAPVLVIRAVEDGYGWGWSDLSSLDAGFEFTEGVIDIPVYACETDTLKILKRYAPGLEIGYGSEEFSGVTVKYWAENQEYISEVYEDEETLKECIEHSYSYGINWVVDPVFMSETNMSEVYLISDGIELWCYYYGDNEKLKQAEEEETQETDSVTSTGIIGGADGPTAIAISATGSQQLWLVVGCLVGLIVVIILARWLTTRRKKK